MSIVNRWIVFILVLPFLNIYYLSMGLWLTMPLKLITIIIAGYILFKKLNKFTILTIFFISIVLFSSLINKTIGFGVTITLISLLALVIYLNYATRKPKELIKGLYYLFATITFINFITLLLPGGIATASNGHPVYFIGGKNAIAMTVLPTACIAYLYSITMYNKIKFVPFIMIVISIISMYLSSSGTGMVIAILSTVFFIFRKRVISFKNLLWLYVVLFINIIILRVQDYLFVNFITNSLGKSLTFTGRTNIWDFIFYKIKDSILLGYGRGNSVILDYFGEVDEAHNGILEIMMFSGLIGVIIFVIILFRIANKMKEYSKNMISKVISIALFSYLIIGLSESVFLKTEFWILLILAYGINNFIEANEHKQSLNRKTELSIQ